MHLERHTGHVHRAALTPTGLVPLTPLEVELLVLVRDDGPHLLGPTPPVCSCRRHASPN